MKFINKLTLNQLELNMRINKREYNELINNLTYYKDRISGALDTINNLFNRLYDLAEKFIIYKIDNNDYLQNNYKLQQEIKDKNIQIEALTEQNNSLTIDNVNYNDLLTKLYNIIENCNKECEPNINDDNKIYKIVDHYYCEFEEVIKEYKNIT